MYSHLASEYSEGELVLIANPMYGLTHDEICQVVLAKTFRPQTGAVHCECCGIVILRFSMDSGLTNKWGAAGEVMRRLHFGRQFIDGRLDR